MKNIKKPQNGFTLVELIIVITILVILGSISYISFQNYTKDTRDAVRLTDIKQIYEGLTIQKIQTQKTPLPEKYIEITNGSGTLTYQGYVGEEIKRQIKITNGGNDPLNGMNYTYTTNTKREKIQILGYLETNNQEAKILGKLKNTITKVNAETTTNSGYYQDKKIYIYGDKIGTITDKNKVPLQETTSNTGIDLTTNTQELKTYFGGEVYENGTSTKTGTTLVNQIISATTNTLPCSEENYNGYKIPSLLDKQTGTTTKTEGVPHGTKITTLTITCNNGTLDHQNQQETKNLTCEQENGYVNNQDNTTCVENLCKGEIPANGESTATSQNINGTWTHNETQTGECTFKCKENYTYNETNKTCEANTKTNQTCTGLPTNNAIWNTVNTINQEWNGTDWTPTTNGINNETPSTTECRFKCENGYTYNSITNTCDGNSCEIPTTETYNGKTYTINGPLTLSHGNTTTKEGTTTFGTNPTNGSITVNVGYSCNAGVLTKGSTTQGNGTCSEGYSFNNNWTNPSCTTNNCTTSTQTINGHSYNVPAFNHGATTTQISNILISNGTRTYSQTFSCNLGIVNTSGGESNTLNNCNSGYHTEDNGITCVSDIKSCTITNGQGSQSWNTGTSSWGNCNVTSCNSGYSISGNSCVTNAINCPSMPPASNQLFIQSFGYSANEGTTLPNSPNGTIINGGRVDDGITCSARFNAKCDNGTWIFTPTYLGCG